MTSKDESKVSRRRVGRKRLPPLAPGPALQFVVASHPDDFKADDTMRNIRSHVMYKHRGDHQSGSRSPPRKSRSARPSSRPISMTRTPSPMISRGEGVLEASSFLAPSARRRSTIWDENFFRLLAQSPFQDSARGIATRIIAASTAAPAQSAPPMFNQASEYPFPSNMDFGPESLEELKNLYIEGVSMCQHRAWMEIVCSNRMSLLSNVCANCVYQDLLEGLLEDSPLTAYAKTKVLPMIQDSLREPGTSTEASDFTALSMLHLFVSEIGVSNEEALDVHLQGLVRIIHQRGGLRNLGMGGRIATYLTTVVLSYSVLRGQAEPLMFHNFVPSNRQSTIPARPLPISPLFSPQGNPSGLSYICSNSAFSMLCDMYNLTRMFILRWNYDSDGFPLQSSAELDALDAHMRQIYTRVLQHEPAETHIAPDWVYESVRLASLIYCRSIVQGLPLADSANVMHAHSGGAAISGATNLTALQIALDNTDKTSNWGDMCGVFLWICLVGGAASWPAHPQPIYGGYDGSHTRAAWSRKFFALYAVNSALACGFEHPAASVETQRTMLQVQSLINLKGGLAGE